MLKTSPGVRRCITATDGNVRLTVMGKLPQIGFEIVVQTLIKKYNTNNLIYSLSTRAMTMSVE